MATVELAGVGKRFGETEVVHDIDLSISDREFVVLVGPSGCGKSTILRMIAGLEDISRGSVLIGGKVVNELEPKNRNIAMVFQDYALYPHLTVARNMSFGLENQGLGRPEINSRVAEAAYILGLDGLMERKPRQLSGGQRQRVAMGRAIVRNPQVFLFDEPLSNLDAKLRGQMRTEIKKLHQRVQTTIVFVTHDQVEAMTLADRVVVLKDGRIEQVGTPDEVYHNPASMFVAGFIGMPTMNFLEAEVSEEGARVVLANGVALEVPAARRGRLSGLSRVTVGIRPENFAIAERAGRGVLDARIDVVEPLGSDTLIFFRAGDKEIVARVPPKLGLAAGDTVKLKADMQAVHFFDPQSERRLAAEGMTMDALAGLTPLIGDLHNHCGISYGHGSLADAFANAAERLDFVSVTGHAFWPDMPAADDRNARLVAFHREGFARLQQCWPQVLAETRAFAASSRTVPFLGFEVHSLADGDMTVVYRDLEGEPLDCTGIPDLQRQLRELDRTGHPAIGFPHHIGYRRGHRGINWDVFDPQVSPVVEIASMHGCAEADEGSRPFLHTMGPADHAGTMRYGLAAGKRFGVIGSTDHHSAHPGSYGHGLTGVWAEGRAREAIWQALLARRCWAMTGDRVDLGFSVGGAAMGGTAERGGDREIAVAVDAGSVIDCVDIIRDGALIRRFSQYEIDPVPRSETVRTLVTLEVGWGPRNVRHEWQVGLGLSAGRILAVEPRFRGREIVSPADGDGAPGSSCFESSWRREGEASVSFATASYGNPTNTTPATQAICLEVEMPRAATVEAEINGRSLSVPLERLIEGALAEPMADMPATSVRFHRAPMQHEYRWRLRMNDRDGANARSYYARVRLANGHFAWASPVHIDG